MEIGAFALIDCLGFKGLWRDDCEALLKKINSINSVVEESLHGYLKELKIHISPDHYTYDVRLLSDSIAVSVRRANETVSENSELIAIAAIVRGLAQLYVAVQPHLLLRGCIAHGSHMMDGNFIVGQAVDDAAEYMDSAEGAFVWYLPPASAMIDEYYQTILPLDLVKKTFAAVFPYYDIPIKGAHFLRSRVINPLFEASNSDGERTIAMYDSVMRRNNMSIWMKRQHTIQFLNNCLELNHELQTEQVVG